MNNTNNHKKGYLQLFLRYWLYWPYFVGSLLFCLALSVLYLRYTTPLYNVSASILITDDKKDNNDPKFLSSLDIFSSTKIVENETEVLKSHVIMDEVVKKLGLYAPIYEEGNFHNSSAYTSSPVKVLLKYPEQMKDIPNDIYFTYRDGAVIIGKTQFPLNSWVDSPWGIIQFIPNPNYKADNKTEKKTVLFFNLVNIQLVADAILGTLNVQASSELSTVINITLKDPVRKRGEDILNELIRYYNLETLKDKNKLAGNSLSFLDERLHYVTADLDSIEKKLQQFKANEGVVDLSEQGRLILGSVEDNDQRISVINVQLAVLGQIQKYINGNGDDQGIILSNTGVDDPVLANYLENLYNAQIQYDKLTKTTAKNNPVLLSLQNQISKIKPTIREYVNNQISSLETSRVNLQNTTDRYTSKIRSIPAKERELLEISRQQSIKNDLYTYLLKKREEAALSYAASVSNVRVVDQAQAAITPVSPKKSIIYGIAGVLGLFLPAIFITLNKKITTKDEIAEILDFPIIGEVSNTSSKEKVIFEEDKKGFVIEQFRQIRTSLSSLDNTKGKRKILVTSSIAGEGKSFTALNLAYSMALAGRKTILVELDLRKPSVGEMFNLGKKSGITEFLKEEVDEHEIVYNTALNDNFYLMPAGKLSSYPSELLLNGKLPLLLNYLEDVFDYVILETAPVGLFTDGFIVSDLSDITLFIIRYNVTPRSELVALRDNLKVRGLKNTAIIFNGVRKFKFQSYGTKYNSYMSKHKSFMRKIAGVS